MTKRAKDQEVKNRHAHAPDGNGAARQAPAGTPEAQGQGAPAAGSAAEPVETAEAPAGQEAAAEVEQLKAELQAVQDKLLRQAAEFQNYRRRTEQERTGLVELGKSTAVQAMLDVLDDFSRSLEAAQQTEKQENLEAAYQALRGGVELVYRKFNDVMKRLGVEPIEAVGKPFDEHEHEALMQQPAPEGTPEGIVLNEFQKGYRMGDRILRHSKVVVSS